MMNQRGFSVMEALVAAALLGTVAMTAATLSTSQNTALRFLAHKAESIDIKMQMQQVFANPDNCACQLNPDLTVDNSNDVALVFDPTRTDGSQRMELTNMKAGCLLSSPIIAADGQAITPDLSVDNIDFAGLRPTGNAGEWTGNWRVQLRSARERISLAHLEVAQTVMIQVTGPTTAKVISCKGPASPGILSVCPPGMAMIGPPNAIGTYCIHRQRQPIATFFQAKSACYNVGAGFGPGHLCDHNEWFTACVDPSAPFDGSAVVAPELVSDFDGAQFAVTAGAGPGGDGPGCRSVGFSQLTDPQGYRCCLK